MSDKRNVYLNTIPVDEALEMYLTRVREVAEKAYEEILVKDSLGRVTKDAIYGKYCSPLYNASAMDGIAVISSRTKEATESNPVELYEGKDYVEVDTGDPVSHPFDAVIMREDLLEVREGLLETREDSLDGITDGIEKKNNSENQSNNLGAGDLNRKLGKVRIIDDAIPWQHIRPIGEDIVAGEMILPSGHQIRPIDIGVLLSTGITNIEVVKKPRVAIIPTGTELIEPEAIPSKGDIIESNSRVFEAMVKDAGGIPNRLSPIKDDYELIKEVIIDEVTKKQVVIVNAGSSAGREDYVPDILREIGEVLVHGVAIRPGKPIILAVVNNTPVIGLPGYPVSAYIDFENFVSPVLAYLAGTKILEHDTVEAVMTKRVVSSLKYKEYVRVKVGDVDGKLVATPLARGAGAAMSLVRSDGFCIIDQNHEGVEAGEKVAIKVHRSLDKIKNTLVVIGSHDLMIDVLADMLSNSHVGRMSNYNTKGVDVGTDADAVENADADTNLDACYDADIRKREWEKSQYREEVYISSTHVGSMGGLMSLTRNEAHLVPIHLLDEETGIYNIPYLKKVCKEPMALIKGVGRIQGLIVKKGNPKNIASLKDIVNCSYVNRQRGSGTRILLDYQLNEMGIDKDDIAGYLREATTHMAVAALVDSESADAGLGIMAAAKAFDLDFVKVAEEEYDFAVPVKFLEMRQIQTFIQVLQSEEFKAKLDELGGYTYKQIGEIVYL